MKEQSTMGHLLPASGICLEYKSKPLNGVRTFSSHHPLLSDSYPIYSHCDPVFSYYRQLQLIFTASRTSARSVLDGRLQEYRRSLQSSTAAQSPISNFTNQHCHLNVSKRHNTNQACLHDPPTHRPTDRARALAMTIAPRRRVLQLQPTLLRPLDPPRASMPTLLSPDADTEANPEALSFTTEEGKSTTRTPALRLATLATTISRRYLVLSPSLFLMTHE
ncbi:hypothetical protein K469DRAFT_305471 [Zopfia rhizophila CBS 207.26]|uniref:Uncharacterized protein n=1 Tax=Zopfia rhizophila CBS 207.26 TaxID=1314779 RepID=A0A6A6ELB9_9PEZI|nr:hypothetical protein K469DRAFT_305471 [Zopfia rhizophila CBS 207.26]